MARWPNEVADDEADEQEVALSAKADFESAGQTSRLPESDDDLLVSEVRDAVSDEQVLPGDEVESIEDVADEPEAEIDAEQESNEELPEGWVDVTVEEWSQELLEAMDWKLFEQLCMEAFRRRGYQAEMTSSGPDGGIDIVAFRGGVIDGKGIAVQCKRNSYPIPAKMVREFFGAALRDDHEEMIFITSNEYNQRAKDEFGDDPRIKLVDGQGLLRVIKSLGGDSEQQLLAAIQRAKYDWQTQTCPKCDVKMNFKVARRSGRRFWGCVNYPKERCMERIYVKKLAK